MRTYTESITLQEVTCKSCGITHAVPRVFLEGKVETGGYYYCPNGHQWGWGESESDRLRKELKREQESNKRLQTEVVRVQDQLEASEREMKRFKSRVANGVCPCCKRTFAQLQRHMKTQHPDYASRLQNCDT